MSEEEKKEKSLVDYLIESKAIWDVAIDKLVGYLDRHHVGFHNFLLLFGIIVLLLCPLGIITAYHSQDPYALGLFIGLTMLFYWLAGIFTGLMKSWKLP